MSYVIVYDRVFVKTPNGYTLVVLHGDNNVWETDRKRARDWGCWMLDAPESEIRSYFNSWIGKEFQQHFRANGKWVDDAGLMRWVDNGLKTAKTLEDIRAVRPSEKLYCYLSVRDNNIPYSEKGYSHDELSDRVETTEDFERWVALAKKRISNKKPSETIYIVTAFSSREPLRLGRNQQVCDGPVIARYKKTMFVSSCSNGRWTQACSNMEKAIVFESVEAAKQSIGRDLSHITFVNVNNLSAKNCTIKVFRNGYQLGYITVVSKSGFRHSSYPNLAKKYTKAAVKQQIGRLKERFGPNYIFECEELANSK